MIEVTERAIRAQWCLENYKIILDSYWLDKCYWSFKYKSAKWDYRFIRAEKSKLGRDIETSHQI